MRLAPFLLLTAAFFAIVAAAAAIAGGISWAIPVALVAIIVAVYALANRKLGEREMASHGGDEQDALRDGREGGLPKAHVIGDDETALGDTPEVHAEISPHDFPKGAPERQAAERMADEEEDGEAETTRGHADPSEREGRLRQPSRSRED
jgi:hypothetical protein